jgi:hypothetical protein
MRGSFIAAAVLAAALVLSVGSTTNAAFNATTSNPTSSFSTTSAAISITSPSPAQGPPGTTVTVSGSGFPGSRTLSATFGGSAVTLSGTTSTAAGGSFSGSTFTVPSGLSVSTAGAHPVVFQAGTWVSPSQTFTITPTVSLSPTTGHVGDTVTISGSGFAASSALTVKYDGTTQTTSPASPTTTSAGVVSSVTFTVPASVAGSHTVSVTDASSNSASATFTVTPQITLVPSSGLPRNSDTITGTGFAASSTISATFSGFGSVTLGGTTTTDANGSFSAATYTVPIVNTAGAYTVTVTDQSSNSGAASYTVIAGMYYSATGPASLYTNATTLSVSYPSGTATNDLMFLVVLNGTNQNITTPSGWTVLADQTTAANNLHFEVMWKLAAAGDTTSTTISSGSNGQSLPQSTINVASVTGLYAPGTFAVTTSNGVQSVTCTNAGGTTLTGCTGGTGTMSTGNAVTQTGVPLAVNTNANGAAAWVVRYVRVGGYPPNPASATANVRQGTASAASTMTPGTDVTTNGTNASVITFAAIPSGNTLSLGTPRSFSLENTASATPGSSTLRFANADIFAPSASTPASPTWSQSGTAAAWAWATVAFN